MKKAGRIAAQVVIVLAVLGVSASAITARLEVQRQNKELAALRASNDSTASDLDDIEADVSDIIEAFGNTASDLDFDRLSDTLDDLDSRLSEVEDSAVTRNDLSFALRTGLSSIERCLSELKTAVNNIAKGYRPSTVYCF